MLVAVGAACGARTAVHVDDGGTGRDGSVVDATASDAASELDARVGDASTDGATIDLVASDAAPVDDASADGGAPDGASTDGATSDGASTDGATSDGATSDGGTTDAAPPRDGGIYCGAVPVAPPPWATPTTSVIARMDYTWDVPSMFLPTLDDDVTLALVASGSSVVGTMTGPDVHAPRDGRAPFVATSSGFTSVGPLDLARDPSDDCRAQRTVRHENIVLTALDLDCDGIGDQLVGRSDVTASGPSDDGLATGTWYGHASWTFRPDDEPPQLSVYAQTDPQDIWHSALLQMDEPVPVPTMTPSVEAGTSTFLTPLETPISPFLMELDYGSATMLPRGVSVGTDVPVIDFAGNTDDDLSVGATYSAWTYPEDGFETPVSFGDGAYGADLQGTASVVHGLGTSIGPISGSRSVFFAPAAPPGDLFPRIISLQVFARDTARTSLLLALRSVSTTSAAGDPSTLAVKITSDRGVARWSLDHTLPLAPTGDASWPLASDVTTVAVPLPAGTVAGDRLEVEIVFTPGHCGAPVAASNGFLVDGGGLE